MPPTFTAVAACYHPGPPGGRMIVNCVAYQEGKRIADIGTGEIGAWVERPECFVWVALSDPEPAELVAMQAQFGLH